MEIPHEDQSSHYDHEKDKFSYLSMRDRIELGKMQVQQSQWGSKYALNGDDSYEHTVGECPTIPTVRDMYGYQSSYTSSWNNHPNLTTQPQPQPSMSTSSLEQAILKISKVMEDFVGEQQKINSHLNEKIDNLESSINVRMEGVYNDLSLRIEKVQDSIEKLTNLDIARGKRKLPPQPHHNLQGTNAKRSRKVLKIDTLVGDCYDNSMDRPSIENHKVQDDKGLPESFKASTSLGKRRETNSLGPNGMDANFVWNPGGIQHEVGCVSEDELNSSSSFWGMMLAKIKVMVKTRENRGEKPKQSNSHHPISATVGNISITSQSSFYAYYISFQILGSQESIGSNGSRFGVETKKLWPFEDDCAKLNGNVAAAPHFCYCWTPSEPHFFAPLCLRLEEAMPQLPRAVREPRAPWDHTHEASHSIFDLLKPSKPIGPTESPVEETMPSKENTRTEAKVLIQPTQKATTDASAPQDLTII
uniref:Uncharacterized protein n=1 Tax=Vitis vinifera TaxID=29760 RepID=A5AW46_VITVI|nr:hypothetical protein VITISV_028732 [Vitis vinifera]